VYFYSLLVYFVVGCEYEEYSPEGDWLCENEDPVAGVFTSEAEALAFVTELKASPEVFKVYLSESETDPNS
jgi:hypothetical protein